MGPVMCRTSDNHAPAMVEVTRESSPGHVTTEPYCWDHLHEMLTTWLTKGQSVTVTKIVTIHEGWSQENFHADRDCPQHGIDTPAGRSGVTTEEVKSTWRVSPPSGPAPSGHVDFYRGWVGYPDGSRSDVERWVRHADGGWLSLDTSRRESGDIVLDE